jgi:hypothetical protein
LEVILKIDGPNPFSIKISILGTQANFGNILRRCVIKSHEVALGKKKHRIKCEFKQQ